MSIINKFIFSAILILFPFNLLAEEVKKVGKFKDWETLVLTKSDGIVCFAQSKPILQSPKNNKRG
jgi:hypothetical protein